MNEPPVGAGAGDTGNANALGQLLAGRDADLVSRAVEARREQRPIDPRNWPGGIEIRFQSPIDGLTGDRCTITILHDERGRYTSSNIPLVDGSYTTQVQHDRLKGSRFVLWTTIPETSPNGLMDDQGKLLKVFMLDPVIPPLELQTNDPLVLEFNQATIYAN